MAQYLVECEGSVREVYLVEAESADEAMRNWASGTLEVQEAFGVGPISAQKDTF